METLYMRRTHRITQHLIDKHKDIAWVDVWHLASPCKNTQRFKVELLASEKRFKCYWCSNVKTLGFVDYRRIEDAVEVCRLLHQMGLPLDRFSMHGSTTYDSEKLREMIKENVE